MMTGLPPGPKNLGFVDILRSGMVSEAPVLQRLADEHGDPFRVPFRGGGGMTFTGHPEALRAVYGASPASFGVWGVATTEPVFGTTSVVVTSGERHRRDRKLLAPPFGATAIRAFGPTIAQIAAAASMRWTPGRPFSMVAEAQEITLDIIVRVVFGIEGGERIRSTRAAVLELIASLSPLLIVFPWMRRSFGGFGPHARNTRAVVALNTILAAHIRARREDLRDRKDVLSLILSSRYDDGEPMSEIEILDQLRALLFAGHETTAVALACTLFWLHREPAVLERLLAEIDGLGPGAEPDELASLPFLEAVCLEGLRLHPPVMDVARVTRMPFPLLGYTIPEGEAIRPSISLLHARPDLYPEPSRFRPERFLERKFSPFEYIPFGGGARRCLGAAFAMYEMKVVLGTLLRACRLRLVSSAPIAHVRRGLTMGPRGGVPMAVSARTLGSAIAT